MMAEAASIAAGLGRTELFSGLSPDELERLAAHATRRRLAAGELLFDEGDDCKGLHIVVSGKLRVFKSSPGGRQQVLAMEGPGTSVAELPVLDGGPYPASAGAVEDTQILFISRPDFRRFCLEHPAVALKILAVVGTRLRRLVGIIEELSFSTVRQRLIAVLLRIAEAQGRNTGHEIEIQLPGTHLELAQELGTVRELVSRNLLRLQAEGLIRVDGRSIVVHDLAGLAGLLEGSR